MVTGHCPCTLRSVVAVMLLSHHHQQHLVQQQDDVLAQALASA